ncbi:MAG TPA: type II toxin-antitoxin system VapC family toxin [Gaiellaceae bacterium]|jgi:predicted nucleic acid-binding protein
MADQFHKPYLDSNVYIWTIVGPSDDPEHHGKHELSADLLGLAEKGNFQLYASTFIEAEVVKAPGDPPLSAAQEATVSGFFERNFFVWVEVDRLIAQKARQLVRDHGWKPPDAIHVATALRAECDQFLTWDKKLRKEKDSYLVEGLEICVPHTAGWQTGFIPPAAL